MIYCDNCGLANRDSSRFCNECGHRLGEWVSCAGCRAQNPVTARFCSSCGERIESRRGEHPVGIGGPPAAEPALPRPAGERKPAGSEPPSFEETRAGVPQAASERERPPLGPVYEETEGSTAGRDDEEPPLEVEAIGISELLDIGSGKGLPDVHPEKAAEGSLARRLEADRAEPSAGMEPIAVKPAPRAGSPEPVAKAAHSPLERLGPPPTRAAASPAVTSRMLEVAPAIALARSGRAALAPTAAGAAPAAPVAEGAALMSQIAAGLDPAAIVRGDAAVKPAGRGRLLIVLLAVVVLLLAALAAKQLGLVEISW